MLFPKLDDSPMFRKQLVALEENSESLKDRCQRFQKGCRKYMEGIGEGQKADFAFLAALDVFRGGPDDPLGESIGGPVMQTFISTLRDVVSFKEVLKTQVEHMLVDRLSSVISIDLNSVKEVRKRFDKASYHYDQARDRFLALKRDARPEVKIELEEEMIAAKAQFEQSRFNLLTALSNVESKKRYEFLESISAFMDAHLRYFKQSYDLLKAIEPYIHQVLTYAQQAKERSAQDQESLAERMHEFRRQQELSTPLRDPSEFPEIPTPPPSHPVSSPSSYMYQFGGSTRSQISEGAMSAQRLVDQMMLQRGSKGKVQVIKQGYLLKRSTGLRQDWLRRYFVLDSRGSLFYYRKHHWSASNRSGGKAQESGLVSLFGRILNRESSATPHFLDESASSTPAQSPPRDFVGGSGQIVGITGREDEKGLSQHSIPLLTATLKPDTDHSDLQFCFRIVTPAKTYSLQAENDVERLDWMDKITAVISSLLNQQLSDLRPFRGQLESLNNRRVDQWGSEGVELLTPVIQPLDSLRSVPGNDVCVDCGSTDPDWASLNLGILMCIECSGFHRNLGVHISKVRSTTLDTRAWDVGTLAYFQAMGNIAANEIWEERLLVAHDQVGDREVPRKPNPDDSLAVKDAFIQEKYRFRRFVSNNEPSSLWDRSLTARKIWRAVEEKQIKAAVRLLVTSHADIHTTFEMALGVELCPSSSPQSAFRFSPTNDENRDDKNGLTPWEKVQREGEEPTMRTLHKYRNEVIGKSSIEGEALYDMSDFSVVGVSSELVGHTDDLHGCTLLHLACRIGDLASIEMLLQHGANVNSIDMAGRSPLHHCILLGHAQCAKVLIQKGADVSLADSSGKLPLDLAVESGKVADDSLFVMLSKT